MASNGIVGSLGDMDRLPEDDVAQARPQRIRHHEVDATAQDLFKAYLNAAEVEEIKLAVQLDQDVDVTVRAGLVAGHRPEQRERASAHRSQLLAVLGQPAQRLVPSHRLPLFDSIHPRTI